MYKGCLIVFEGIDGSGKSEQYRRLIKNLEKERYYVVPTKEPTPNQPIGMLIRKVLYESTEVTEKALALLFAADRADHTERKIKPALKDGAVVVSDRYVHSSLAYQSRGMKTELDLNWLYTINRFALDPDIVVFLDISPEVGQNRLVNGQKRVQDHTYFEDLIQQEKIRSIYYEVLNLDRKVTDLFDFEWKKAEKIRKYKMVRINNTVVLRIDGTLSIEEIEKMVLKYVKNYLEEKKIPKIDSKTPVKQKLIKFTENN